MSQIQLLYPESLSLKRDWFKNKFSDFLFEIFYLFSIKYNYEDLNKC